MKRRLKELAMLIAILGATGAIVVVSGIVPIKASSGHWPVTQWILNFASDRSIALHSAGIEAPALDEPGMVTLGAAIYESNCRWCHGRPGQQRQAVVQGMTPKPPNLSDAVRDYESEELFYVVKHGIKFTGMPAWPVPNRDTEIWPVVAFLKALPNMDETTYLGLVALETESDELVTRLAIRECAACHGKDGSGRAGERVPMLAGQSELYLNQSLRSYRDAERFSGVMQSIASQLSDDEINQLSAYFAAKSPDEVFTGRPSDEDLWLEGERLANEGDQQQKIASCIDCHGSGPMHHDEYPQLAGQSAWYIRQQLMLFSERRRGGSENASLMHPIADKLNDRERIALATYFANPKNSDE